ncbi:MAG: hypothetical protein ABI851_16010 [Saprospiraceae bacterium]
MSKTHWKKLQNPNYLGAYSLNEGQDLIVEIVDIKREAVKGEGGKSDECTIAYLKDAKPMILNATNQKMITKIYGTPYVEEWVGKKITLYVSSTNLRGEKVECLRIRDLQVTSKKKPELTPEHSKWKGAMKAIAEGTYSLQKLSETFTISEENKALLVDSILVAQ